MSNCPICQAEFTKGECDRCAKCGWDLTPYPASVTPDIRPIILSKERVKVAWAKRLWTTLRSQQDELRSASNMIQQLEQETRVLQSHLTQISSSFNPHASPES
ncbi:hypothetical protein J0895_07745, partial [Phormidium pseudopriestleyi FRX01]|nr:hypothetical protein [Phormidium pseudopriestleyi FRX01]